MELKERGKGEAKAAMKIHMKQVKLARFNTYRHLRSMKSC